MAGLVALARPLLQRPPRPDSLGRLTLEAAALELTARLLRFNLGCRNPRSHRARIDEAADIIRAEYRQPLTIAALARRVGLNECYLKRYYKAQTGETIAASLRRHRLHAALRLLNDGATVQQAMAAAGYRSPGHFGAAFKKQFGCLPREVVQGNPVLLCDIPATFLNPLRPLRIIWRRRHDDKHYKCGSFLFTSYKRRRIVTRG